MIFPRAKLVPFLIRPCLGLAVACQMRAFGNNGDLLWRYTPHSFTLGGAKIKGAGSLLVADLDGDGYLDVVGGDDETWLNAVKTDAPCQPFAVVSGQFHGDSRHSGKYVKPGFCVPENSL